MTSKQNVIYEVGGYFKAATRNFNLYVFGAPCGWKRYKHHLIETKVETWSVWSVFCFICGFKMFL